MSKMKDVLSEDPSVPDQEFLCVSFLSPEDEIERRDHFMFQSFVDAWETRRSLEQFDKFVGFISYKYDLKIEDLKADMSEFCEVERKRLNDLSVAEEYKSYLDANGERLEEEYNRRNDFQTSVRGVKFRGSFRTQAEAEGRARELRDMDPSHDVYVGPVGKWMPFHPDAYKTGRVEHLEQELNRLMHSKNDNEARAREHFKNRVATAKEEAITANIKNATTAGTTLTQTLDADGNLRRIDETDQEHALIDDTIAELRKGVMDRLPLGTPEDTDK